jgi:hypothetical protein
LKRANKSLKRTKKSLKEIFKEFGRTVKELGENALFYPFQDSFGIAISYGNSLKLYKNTGTAYVRQ